MAHLQNALRNVIDDTMLQINRRLRDKLRTESDQAIEQHRNVIQALRDLAKDTSATDQLQDSIDALQRETVAFIEDKTRKRLRSIATSAEVVQMIDILTQRFGLLVEDTFIRLFKS